jgi:hypothetical protein
VTAATSHKAERTTNNAIAAPLVAGECRIRESNEERIAD